MAVGDHWGQPAFMMVLLGDGKLLAKRLVVEQGCILDAQKFNIFNDLGKGVKKMQVENVSSQDLENQNIDTYEIHTDKNSVFQLTNYEGINSKGEKSMMFKFEKLNKESKISSSLLQAPNSEEIKESFEELEQLKIQKEDLQTIKDEIILSEDGEILPNESEKKDPDKFLGYDFYSRSDTSIYRIFEGEQVDVEDNPHLGHRVVQVLKFDPQMFVFIGTDYKISLWSEATEEFVSVKLDNLYSCIKLKHSVEKLIPQSQKNQLGQLS